MDSNQPEADRAGAINIAALARKYAEEPAKHLRPDGLDEYRPLEAMGEQFVRDPRADPGFVRKPLGREAEGFVVGGGFAGLLCAANLRKQGIEEITIIDRAADFGGTWYWNRHLGERCDVESYVYIPLLEETGFMPSEKYAKGAKILDQC